MVGNSGFIGAENILHWCRKVTASELYLTSGYVSVIMIQVTMYQYK